MQEPSSKLTRAKRARGMDQVVEHLPSKHEALSSNPSTIKNKKKMVVVIIIITITIIHTDI
jgi:hypothetical protein